MAATYVFPELFIRDYDDVRGIADSCRCTADVREEHFRYEHVLGVYIKHLTQPEVTGGSILTTRPSADIKTVTLCAIWLFCTINVITAFLMYILFPHISITIPVT